MRHLFQRLHFHNQPSKPYGKDQQFVRCRKSRISFNCSIVALYPRLFDRFMPMTCVCEYPLRPFGSIVIGKRVLFDTNEAGRLPAGALERSIPKARLRQPRILPYVCLCRSPSRRRCGNDTCGEVLLTGASWRGVILVRCVAQSFVVSLMVQGSCIFVGSGWELMIP